MHSKEVSGPVYLDIPVKKKSHYLYLMNKKKPNPNATGKAHISHTKPEVLVTMVKMSVTLATETVATSSPGLNC